MNNESKNRSIGCADDHSENCNCIRFSDFETFEQRLKRFGIKVSGKNSDSIEKFFSGDNSAIN